MPRIIISYLVYCIMWGIICYRIVRKKGYMENWFLLGFFFGVIAYILAVRKPDYSVESYSSNVMFHYDDNSLDGSSISSKTKTGETWTCYNCKRENPDSANSCSCGMTKINSYERYKKMALQKHKLK